jgi:transcriptional regulator with XRE-family HTH domain
MTKSVFTKDYNYFRELLINSRKKVNLTQEDVAQKLSKHQSFVSKYETGERRLDVIEFIEISNALGINPLEIIKDLLENNENSAH